jgi:hypothetical protein
LSKLGVKNLRIVASDDDPSGKGESKFKFEVVTPKTLQATKRVVGIQESEPNEVSIVLDGQVMLNAGCKDMNKLWYSWSDQSIKRNGGDPATYSASWPFNKSKRKGPLLKFSADYTIADFIKFQNTTFPLEDFEGKDEYGRGYSIGATDLSLPVDWQILCQVDSGDLVILR